MKFSNVTQQLIDQLKSNLSTFESLSDIEQFATGFHAAVANLLPLNIADVLEDELRHVGFDVNKRSFIIVEDLTQWPSGLFGIHLK